jgi:hypothetical protein
MQVCRGISYYKAIEMHQLSSYEWSRNTTADGMSNYEWSRNTTAYVDTTAPGKQSKQCTDDMEKHQVYPLQQQQRQKEEGT